MRGDAWNKMGSLCVLRWVTVLTSIALGCHGARILAVFSTPSRSHAIAFEALTTELAARGHQLTVISMFPQKKPLANYTDVVVPFNMYGMDKLAKFELRDVKVLTIMLNFMKLRRETCKHFLETPGVQTLIHSTDDVVAFDLVIVEFFFNECLLGFAHRFHAPIVGLYSSGPAHWMLDVMGNTSPYAYTPDLLLESGDHMNFVQRLKNTVIITVSGWFRAMVTLPSQDALLRKYFNASEPIPYVGDIERTTSLLLVNSHVSLSYPRPYLPNVVEVGGMHIKPGKKLSSDLQKYLDEAKDGVVYFSMGSNLKSSEMPVAKRQAFLDAFSKLKQRVLWKWEEESLPGQPENVRLGKWLPQSSILEHPNVRLFITHGGMLSVQEAIYHSVPILGIPIFGDQQTNMNNAERMGIGVKLIFDNITTESVQWALDRLLNEPSYRECAARLSARFRDQPTTPLERAVYWTEYIIRHKGAPHLRSAALDLAWYQTLLLDVIALLLFGASLVGLLLYVTTKVVVRRVCGGKIEGKRKTN